MHKTFKDDDVYEAANKRLDVVFGHFEKVYVSFSGGKDSSILLQLAIEKASSTAGCRSTCCSSTSRANTSTPSTM